MGDKTVDDAKKTLKLELKVFGKKTKKTLVEAKKLRLELVDLNKKGADQQAAFDVQKSLKQLEKSYLKEMSKAEKRLKLSMRDIDLPKEEQNGMAKWYAKILAKESGFDLGGGVKLWGDANFKKKEVKLILKGTF